MKNSIKNILVGTLALVSVGAVGAGVVVLKSTVNKDNAQASTEQEQNNYVLSDFGFEGEMITNYFGELGETLVFPSGYTNNGQKTMELELRTNAAVDAWTTKMAKKLQANDNSPAINIVYRDAKDNAGIITTIDELKQLSLYVAEYPVVVKFKDDELVKGADNIITTLSIDWSKIDEKERNKVKKIILPEAFRGFRAGMESSINRNEYTFSLFKNLEQVVLADEKDIEPEITTKNVSGLIVANKEIIAISPTDIGTKLVMPEGLVFNSEFGYSMFGNSDVTEFVANDTINSIPSGLFFSSKVKNVTLGANVTVINDHAFIYSPVESVNFDELTNLQVIGENAFWNTKLSGDIVLPNSVQQISEGAFGWCENITSITIPASVSTIGVHAFTNFAEGCKVYLQSRVASIDSNFGGYGANNATFYVQADDLDYYKGINSQYNWQVVDQQQESSEYVIVWDANGGTGTMANSVISSSTTNVFPRATYTRAGWTFMGWATVPTGLGKTIYSSDKAIDEEFLLGKDEKFTMYAVWGKKFTLNFSGGVYGTQQDSTIQYFVEGESLDVAVPKPTKSGYVFMGYYTQENGRGTRMFNEACKAQFELSDDLTAQTDMILYAYWTLDLSGSQTY